MKAVILCGGKGTRLKEETEYKPKPLVEIGGKPILWHILKLYSYQGIKDFVLCLGYKGNMIKDYFLKLEEMSNDFVLDLKKNKIYHLSDEDDLDVTIHFIDTGDDSMTGARIARIKKYVENDEDFFVTYGDGVADIDICGLYKFHKNSGKIATLTAIHPTYKFGLVEIQGDQVIKFDEKPDMKDWVNGGFMVFNKKVFDYLSTDKNCILEQDPLRKLTEERQLAAYKHNGFWKCMDTQKDLDEFNILLSKNPHGAPWEIWKNNKLNKNFNGNIFPLGNRILISNREEFANKMGFSINPNIKGDELNNPYKNE